ncbi:MAG TPA: hypothetical protein VNK43_00030 [Gemmatimonadales bacterium]|nr:hypothetical protein [Gemmatimonadales bacterium]
MVLASSLARALGMDARTGEREVAEDGSGDGSTREPSAPADTGPGRAAGPARRLDDGGPLARKIAAAVGRIFAELLGGQQATGAGETDGPVAHGPIQGDVDACNGAPPRLPVGPRVVAAVDGEVVNRSLGAAGRPGTPAGQPRHPGAAAPLRGASASPEVPGGPGELAAGRPDRNSEPTAGNSVSGDVAPPVALGDGIASTGDMPLAREGTEPGRPVRGAAPASGSPTVGDRGPGDRVTLHLTDDAGGVTRVRIAVRGERLRATIVPPDGEAARRLRVATGELERSLAQHGFPDARVTVQASMPAAPPSEAGPHWFSAPPPSGPSEVAVARGQDAPTSDPHRGSDGHPSDRRGQRQDRPHDRPHDRPAEGRERQGS